MYHRLENSLDDYHVLVNLKMPGLESRFLAGVDLCPSRKHLAVSKDTFGAQRRMAQMVLLTSSGRKLGRLLSIPTTKKDLAQSCMVQVVSLTEVLDAHSISPLESQSLRLLLQAHRIQICIFTRSQVDSYTHLNPNPDPMKASLYNGRHRQS